MRSLLGAPADDGRGQGRYTSSVNTQIMNTQTRRHIRMLVTLLGVLVATSACGSGRQDAASPFDGPAPSAASRAEDPIRVEIQNLSFNDVTVWSVRAGGDRRRIARVTGKTDETVTINWNVAVPISFFIEQTAGRSCSTPQIGVDPQARIWIQIPSNVGQQPCRAGRR